MNYITNPVNESPVISRGAGEPLEDVRGKAVKFDADGNIVIAKTGDEAIGIGLISNDLNIPIGNDVDVQVNAIGLVKTGAAVAAGDCLAPSPDGSLTAAGSGTPYIAVAIQASSAAGAIIQAVISRGTAKA